MLISRTVAQHTVDQQHFNNSLGGVGLSGTVDLWPLFAKALQVSPERQNALAHLEELQIQFLETQEPSSRCILKGPIPNLIDSIKRIENGVESKAGPDKAP